MKQGKPEMYDFERKKNWFKRKKRCFKILKISKFLTDTLAKISQLFLHFIWFQNILSIFFYLEKKNFNLLLEADAAAKNASLFYMYSLNINEVVKKEFVTNNITIR